MYSTDRWITVHLCINSNNHFNLKRALPIRVRPLRVPAVQSKPMPPQTSWSTNNNLLSPPSKYPTWGNRTNNTSNSSSHPSSSCQSCNNNNPFSNRDSIRLVRRAGVINKTFNTSIMDSRYLNNKCWPKQCRYRLFQLIRAHRNLFSTLPPQIWFKTRHKSWKNGIFRSPHKKWTFLLRLAHPHSSWQRLKI